MNRELLEMMEQITEEEQRILDGNGIEKDLYTNKKQFVVDKEKMLEQGKTIAVRPHTRFVSFPRHRHNYIEVLYVCKGCIIHHIEGTVVRMEPGDLLFLNQYTTHSIEETGKDDIGINLMILPQFFDYAIQMLGRDNIIADFMVSVLSNDVHEGQYLLFKTAGIVQIENVMENIIYSIAHKQDDDQMNQILMGVLFQYLLKYVTALDKNSETNYDEVLTRSTLDYIHQNYKTASLSELAAMLNQSPSGMSRLIKKKSGFSFKELLQRKRFQQAILLLTRTELPVNDIIAAVGYENNSYFYRQFREKYQVSPKNYREQHKDDKEIIL
ncbi:MAG: AraC family transcriptional regulator [Clostridia bacterium]|nr:AraC family transcriptional regulator [Clostridia bacterium]